jgi:hypothetical protein
MLPEIGRARMLSIESRLDPPDAVAFTLATGRIVGHSYKAQIDPAGPVTS